MKVCAKCNLSQESAANKSSADDSDPASASALMPVAVGVLTSVVLLLAAVILFIVNRSRRRRMRSKWMAVQLNETGRKETNHAIKSSFFSPLLPILDVEMTHFTLLAKKAQSMSQSKVFFKSLRFRNVLLNYFFVLFPKAAPAALCPPATRTSSSTHPPQSQWRGREGEEASSCRIRTRCQCTTTRTASSSAGRWGSRASPPPTPTPAAGGGCPSWTTTTTPPTTAGTTSWAPLSP